MDRPPTLNHDGVRAVKEQVAECERALKDVRQHLRENVTGVGLEDAINSLQEQSYRLRRVYGAEKVRNG